ncbi:MAG TPA: valine--tRNA ligase [Candidatus Limnocylindrales bacterium]|nr:valine--tRNA ligase [Candidatus Limnocylindrales bacterium]
MRDAPTGATGTAGQAAMARAYQPAEVEPAVYERWLAADVFAPDGSGSRARLTAEPFVVIMPPPNVTGALHLGHAARSATEDLMIRRARMQQRPVLWLPGVDHASIAAQWVLRRVLADEGTTPERLGRERYLERMWRFMDETRPVIMAQQRRLGSSADWSRERFTMDKGSARAVRVAFTRLYEDGLAYRGQKLVNWCPGCGTSISDLEVIGTPEEGTLWSIRYHLLPEGAAPGAAASANETITVATTRPETILGDTAVAVHPDDARYARLVGRTVRIPFVDRDVPIIADASVDLEFGTGAVKVTPAHDHTDFATGLRHGLPRVDIMTDAADMNEEAGPYAGLSREEARLRVLADLEASGDLVAATPHQLAMGRCQRSDDVVEPRLKTQWFIDVKPMAARAMGAVRERRTRFVPERFEKVFFDWLENIHDWNVSRQLWWGHRIPAWYCPDGHVTVSDVETGPGRCLECSSGELVQDDDTFDTWFSSGLWPFSTLGWPDETHDLRTYYPTSVMETGHDILFFWVARMMMLGEWLTNQEPFSVVYLSGLIRDPYGKKMSKTKGNVIDPLAIMDEIGADALRFALVHGAAPGADLSLGPSRLEGARNFANKLWNAARFVLGSRPAELPADAVLGLPERERLGPAEHWILWRCHETVRDAEAAYSSYQFAEAARILHVAIWSEYCDWYLEMAKVRLGPDVEHATRVATWQVLAWVLDRYLRMLHPVMPHITEEIWGRLPHRPEDGELLITASWPSLEQGESPADEAQTAAVADIIELVSQIRNARADAAIEPATWLDAELRFDDAGRAAAFEAMADVVARLARLRPRVVAAANRTSDQAALVVVSRGAEARLSVSGGDRERNRVRLEKELAQTERLLASTRAKLADGAFVSKAPAPVVDAVRSTEVELRDLADRIREHLAG